MHVLVTRRIRTYTSNIYVIVYSIKYSLYDRSLCKAVHKECRICDTFQKIDLLKDFHAFPAKI